MRTWSVISIIAENKPHSHHNSLFPRSPLGTPGTMASLCVVNTKKSGMQIMSLADSWVQTFHKVVEVYRRLYEGGKFVFPTIQTSVKFRDFVEQYVCSLWTYHF